MLTTKIRKLQSNYKLNTKLSHIPHTVSITQGTKNTDNFAKAGKEEIQTFTLDIIEKNQNKLEYVSQSSSEKSKKSQKQSIKLQQAQKKVNQRQENRKTKGLAAKMKIKLQEQIKMTQRQLEQRLSQLKQIQSQIQMLGNLAIQRKKHTEDICNNQQMLRFKQNQLTSLNNIHSEIIESAKNQLLKQKLINIQNKQKLKKAQKKLKICKQKQKDRQNLLLLIQQLTKQKVGLQNLLERQQKADQKKTKAKTEKISQIVQKLIKKNKNFIQEQCQQKARIIRQKSLEAKDIADFKLLLQRSGIPSVSYFTFSQLKTVKQLKFKTNKQTEKILKMLEKQVNPKIIQIDQVNEDSKQMLQLNAQMKKLQKQTIIAEDLLKLRQIQAQQLQIRSNSLRSALADLKKKSQAK